MANRIQRASEEIKREIGAIIQKELKDPRLPDMVSVMSVEVARDFRHAKVYITVMGGAQDKENALLALSSAAGYIRGKIGHRVKMRFTPELHFVIDDSIEKSIYISNLINKTVHRKNAEQKEQEQQD